MATPSLGVVVIVYSFQVTFWSRLSLINDWMHWPSVSPHVHLRLYPVNTEPAGWSWVFLLHEGWKLSQILGVYTNTALCIMKICWPIKCSQFLLVPPDQVCMCYSVHVMWAFILNFVAKSSIFIAQEFMIWFMICYILGIVNSRFFYSSFCDVHCGCWSI